MNPDSYYYDEITFDTSGYLGKFIDCAYVLTMEDSSRRYTIRERLDYAPPCRRVIIQYNKGYKKSAKPNLPEQKSYFDIIDAYYHALFHYNTNFKNKGRVLLLEDDFVFTPEIKSSKTHTDIENILNNEKVDLLQLGHVISVYNPTWLFRTRYNFRRHMHAPVCHCVIYSEGFIEKFLRQYPRGEFPYIHFDKAHSSEYCSNFWVYDYPLAVQAFSRTENSKNWDILGVKTYDGLSLAIDTFNLNTTDHDALTEGFKKTNKFNYLANILGWGATLVLPCALIFSLF